MSDHTAGHATALGSIALGARAIEKHFTDDNRVGPDHKFSMNPSTWKQMISASRELEKLWGGYKKLEKNEKLSVIVQRRGVWAKKELKNDRLLKTHLKILRPCPKDSSSI